MSLGPAEILVLLVVVVLVFVGAGRSSEVAGCRTGA